MRCWVFVFVGEFGYELLNWQGVVRRLGERLPDDEQIVACSRTALGPFYEVADAYVDVSGLPAYRASTAAGYTVVGRKVDRINAEVQAYVFERLPELQEMRTRFCFSHTPREFGGLQFGRGSIYGQLPLENNRFARIEPDLGCRDEIEERLGFSLESGFVLCQSARRETVVRSKDRLSIDGLLERFSRRLPVVLLEFDTGRSGDSLSAFDQVDRCHRFQATSFREQGCLIYFARACLFFTEGDFRSHAYVPPFLGRDVFVVAPRSVYEVSGYQGENTSPIEFWNEHIFRFGGRIRPFVDEDVCRDERSIDEFLDQLLG